MNGKSKSEISLAIEDVLNTQMRLGVVGENMASCVGDGSSREIEVVIVSIVELGKVLARLLELRGLNAREAAEESIRLTAGAVNAGKSESLSRYTGTLSDGSTYTAPDNRN